MNKRKLTLGYVPMGNGTDIYPFNAIFENSQNVLADGFKGVDAVILWGGEDWHPSYYNQKAHWLNGKARTEKPSYRDVFEWKTMLFCKMNDIPMIGVCRGAQGLCISAGGKLIQHVDKHGGNHGLSTIDGKSIQANSTHHQMMYPYDVPHELVAWAAPRKSTIYEGESPGFSLPEMEDKKEAEIVWFPAIKGLAIQGHPEYSSAPAEFVHFCVDAVKKYLDFDRNPNAKGFGA